MSRLLSQTNFLLKVVLVTGASSGIGREVAIQFACLGAHLSICGRNREKLTEAVGECANAKLDPTQQIVDTICDVPKEEDVQRLVDVTVKQFSGQLNVLVID